MCLHRLLMIGFLAAPALADALPPDVSARIWQIEIASRARVAELGAAHGLTPAATVTVTGAAAEMPARIAERARDVAARAGTLSAMAFGLDAERGVAVLCLRANTPDGPAVYVQAIPAGSIDDPFLFIFPIEIRAGDEGRAFAEAECARAGADLEELRPVTVRDSD